MSSCYEFVSNPKTNWMDARAKCVERGGHLLALETQEEMDFIAQCPELSGYRIWWTAGNDRDNEGVWEWADVDRPFSSIPGRWYDGEPNDAEGGEHCAHVYLDEGGTLNDRSCNEAGGFICEFELTD
ncbi:hypothetical protein CAPTEDRAFT_158497 [Capitella teleta]|uniref:C-type lectin domain-containing protein n=1 Tax=Capitella teleta TaxID=283909 RepID=R7V8K5_CAPTE|nr:hypothetical protein CAPTEDRAFT_158497 [Capitella teleta]|eukprot:ELU14904.1 hypothetical protein CAPTEDRAFT_158497 [Capitella teleta]